MFACVLWPFSSFLFEIQTDLRKFGGGTHAPSRWFEFCRNNGLRAFSKVYSTVSNISLNETDVWSRKFVGTGRTTPIQSTHDGDSVRYPVYFDQHAGFSHARCAEVVRHSHPTKAALGGNTRDVKRASSTQNAIFQIQPAR